MTSSGLLSLAEEVGAAWAPRAAEYDRTAAFPQADMDDLRSSGLLGLLVPDRLGGMGAGFEDYVRVAVRLARSSGASALLFNMHASVTGALARVPDDLVRALGAPQSFLATRDEVLERAVAGAMYGVAISEIGAGPRLSALQTYYRKEDGKYRIRGRKSTCSGAGHLDAYLVAARDAAVPEEGSPRISYFLVPNADIGDVEQRWDPLGMRGTASNGFTIDACVDEAALLGVEGIALLLAHAMPEWLVASYAAVYVGVAQAAIAAAAAYVGAALVREPANEGPAREVGLGSSPWVRQRLGRADAQVEAARLAVEEAGRQVDANPGDAETSRAVYRAKLLAGDTAFEVAASLAEACGLGALMRGSDLERILRDARSGAVMPPSSDIAANVLGAAVLGTDPGVGLGARPW
ncbi:MAG: acyl-CoA/acyl-ACP dehydrogenase [Actinobacteria bacterium]|nr:acyl-CoA/acyl-ACP dehydrogenase [Actinomycetota bacterium]